MVVAEVGLGVTETVVDKDRTRCSTRQGADSILVSMAGKIQNKVKKTLYVLLSKLMHQDWTVKRHIILIPLKVFRLSCA